ncbi:MAG: hypothetical protein V3W34_00875 [Phycisphaerae bacterium]
MSIRSRSRLGDDQAALLAAYRSRTGVAQVGPAADEVEVVSTMGKVTSVVTSDPDYGAHLVVASQEFAGTPPSASDAPKPSLRAYPTPNRVVTDYAVDEYVQLATARGALLAVKLG